MKKLIATLSAVTLLFGTLAVPVSAESYQISDADSNTIITPYYVYIKDSKNTIAVSGNSATCRSELYGAPAVTKVTAIQYLEKKNSGGSWTAVAAWNGSANGSVLKMQNTKSGLAKGTYRVRTYFTMYAGSKTEKVERASASKTI